MNIAIAGGSGFIGSTLCNHLVANGYSVYILTRQPSKKEGDVTYVQWLSPTATPEDELPTLDAFINLAGDSIGSGRWTKKKKQQILQSRLNTTTSVLQLLQKLPTYPNVFLNASAIGYYGHSLSETFTETKDQGGNSNFLSDVVKQWEETARRAKEELQIRTVFLRFGLVLDRNVGAFPKMLLPYQLFAGGPLGSGKQWYSWIHIRDVVQIIEFLMHREEINGPVNVTAPTPVPMNEMGKAIAKRTRRPHYLPTPTFALKLALGEMSSLLLEGQKVIPEKLLTSGYSFSYPKIEDALDDILTN